MRSNSLFPYQLDGVEGAVPSNDGGVELRLRARRGDRTPEGFKVSMKRAGSRYELQSFMEDASIAAS
jgi:hypothetical protein